MGRDRDDNNPKWTETIPYDYWIAKHQFTYARYKAFPSKSLWAGSCFQLEPNAKDSLRQYMPNFRGAPTMRGERAHPMHPYSVGVGVRVGALSGVWVAGSGVTVCVAVGVREGVRLAHGVAVGVGVGV